jgi:hypothetical protein
VATPKLSKDIFAVKSSTRRRVFISLGGAQERSRSQQFFLCSGAHSVQGPPKTFPPAFCFPKFSFCGAQALHRVLKNDTAPDAPLVLLTDKTLKKALVFPAVLLRAPVSSPLST